MQETISNLTIMLNLQKMKAETMKIQSGRRNDSGLRNLIKIMIKLHTLQVLRENWKRENVILNQMKIKDMKGIFKKNISFIFHNYKIYILYIM